MDQIELLHRQFGEILIPNAVLDELKVHEERPGSQAIREAILSGWIQTQDVSNEPLAQLLKQTLDRGEAEAIALAVGLCQCVSPTAYKTPINTVGLRIRSPNWLAVSVQ
ncbi:hypothetical protein [Nostoc sp.]|uniref:hypothetical protein n=1 Tax=Nostoc sp. TaxID=1180 RepID=UPI0035934816